MSTVDATFRALADPTRRAILQRLTRGPATVGDIASPFSISIQATSKHLRVLEGARLILKHKSGRERVISLNRAALREVEAFIVKICTI